MASYAEKPEMSAEKVTVKAAQEIKKNIGEGNWAVRYKIFINESVKSGATIFLGNSHTEIFDLSCFVDTLIVNRGISGDVTEGVLKRLPEIYRFNPKKIFIEIDILNLSKYSKNIF